MKRIVAPTKGAKDWRRLLARPGLHWREGRSAMTLAQSWEAAHPSAPPEVERALQSSGDPLLMDLSLLLAIPEYQVDLPGGQRPSQTDVLALMRGRQGVVAVAVEGKVDEPFGPTVGEKRSERSAGVDERLEWLIGFLGLGECPDAIRYQLLHRTASALLIAQQFDAKAAVMLVHSFSPSGLWFDDFSAFAALLGADAAVGTVSRVEREDGVPLFIGWCRGDERFRTRL
ncbi:MAG: hypothetical protein QMD76_03205 [Anaerosomatales bacterium]|nr:hypothetical protein [Anaerosomatales bacterium]GAV32256.1 hypothetical protein emb_1d0850 [Coriobacteriaceae bacterium EMTCatB1]